MRSHCDVREEMGYTYPHTVNHKQDGLPVFDLEISFECAGEFTGNLCLHGILGGGQHCIPWFLFPAI